MTSTISKRLEKIQDIVDNIKDSELQREELEKERYKCLCHGLRRFGYDEETIKQAAPLILKQADERRALRFANLKSGKSALNDEVML